jgi:hypothetical protein
MMPEEAAVLWLLLGLAIGYMVWGHHSGQVVNKAGSTAATGNGTTTAGSTMPPRCSTCGG